MELLLGVDVGTTATKAILINAKGELISSASHNYCLITPNEDWVEQDPEDFWQGVVITCRQLMKSVGPEDKVLALGISSQGGTTIPIGSDGIPIRNAISWMDHRAHNQTEVIRNNTGDDKIYNTTGWPLVDCLPLLHICWMRELEPDVFSSTRYYLFVNDFIINRLTGRLCMDPSNAGITQLYNLASGQWDEDMLRIAGISSEQLSPVKDSGFAIGQLTKEASRETGLPESTLVVNGAHDQYCAAVGCGVLRPGDIMLSCGTAWVLLCFMEHLRLDPDKRLSISRHAIPGRWGAIKSLGGVGACMEWFLNNMWQNGQKSGVYNELNKQVMESKIGSKGLVFLPSSGGYGRGTRGGFIGLTLNHSRGDLARAIMEGITFELRWTIEDLVNSGINAKELRMVGGAATSPIWPEIVADITHLPVTIPSITQAAAYGAAILAGVGYGLFSDVISGYQNLSKKEKHIEPKAEICSRYDKLFQIYQNTFEQIKSSLADLWEFESE